MILAFAIPKRNFSETRNPAGQLTEKTETVLGLPTTREYRYDALGRLTEVWQGGVRLAEYAYDANGNRGSKKVTDLFSTGTL